MIRNGVYILFCSARLVDKRKPFSEDDVSNFKMLANDSPHCSKASNENKHCNSMREADMSRCIICILAIFLLFADANAQAKSNEAKLDKDSGVTSLWTRGAISSRFQFDKDGQVCRIEMSSESMPTLSPQTSESLARSFDQMILRFSPPNERGAQIESTSLTLTIDGKYAVGIIQQYEKMLIYKINTPEAGEYVVLDWNSKACEETVPRFKLPVFTPNTPDK